MQEMLRLGRCRLPVEVRTLPEGATVRSRTPEEILVVPTR